MKLSTVQERMPLWYKNGTSIHLEGGPGLGKSSVIEQAPDVIGKRYGLNLGIVVINGAMLTPMDVLGYGVPKHYENHTEMRFSDPFFWRTEEGKRLEEYDGGILFVDEQDKADTDTKKILGEGRLSGRFGPHRLAKGWLVWSAGNRAQDRSGSGKKLDHEINRYQEIAVNPDLASWNEWALTRGVMPLTIAFANQNPHLVFSDTVPEKQGPWCTPRSLVSADGYLRLLAQEFGEVPDDATTIEEVGGRIGAGAAAQYFAFVKLERNMPKFERIIADPSGVKVPEKPDAAMLICYNLAHRVDENTAKPVITYVERMPKEFSVTFAHAACKRDPKLVRTPAFQKWAMDNSSLMAAIAR